MEVLLIGHRETPLGIEHFGLLSDLKDNTAERRLTKAHEYNLGGNLKISLFISRIRAG